MGVSKNRGTPKSSILIGFSIINHPFWGTPILETSIYEVYDPSELVTPQLGLLTKNQVSTVTPTGTHVLEIEVHSLLLERQWSWKTKKSRWWFQTCFICSPLLGETIQFD